MNFWVRRRLFVFGFSAVFIFAACGGASDLKPIQSAAAHAAQEEDTPTFLRAAWRETPQIKLSENKKYEDYGTALQVPKAPTLSVNDSRPSAVIPMPKLRELPKEEPQESPKKEESPEKVNCKVEKCVALTFDDGPATDTTPQLLDALAKEKVPATFFVLGSRTKASPKIVKRMANEGHEIGSHTWNHADLTALSAKAAHKDLKKTNSAIKKVTGEEPKLLRPPYGSTNKHVAKAAEKAELSLVLWDVDSRDWEHHDPKKTIRKAQDANAGSIILLHDIHPSTVKSVPKIIKKLRKAGFTFVTVSQLLGEVKPGESHFRQ